jgi:hypothetical protein
MDALADRNSRWHIFDLLPPSSIDEVLEEIERVGMSS